MTSNLFDLTDKVAVITGASRGIGREISLAMAREGADIVLASRKLPDLEGVAEEVRSLGRRALAVSAHNGKMEDLADLVKRSVEEFGRIDILVNNAATNPMFGPVINSDEGVWDKIMSVNLKGCFFLSKMVCEEMQKTGGGRIINISTVGGLKPDIGLGIYSISKAGLIMMTKVLAHEWAVFNIRVNCIAPGLIQTKFSEALWGSEEVLKIALPQTPMGRIGQADEVAAAAVYLASDASSYTTGSVLVIDGGFLT